MTHGEGGNTRPTSTRGIVVVFAISVAAGQYIGRATRQDFLLIKRGFDWINEQPFHR